jgi:hypothetical protein
VRAVLSHQHLHPSLDLGKFLLKVFHVVIPSMLNHGVHRERLEWMAQAHLWPHSPSVTILLFLISFSSSNHSEFTEFK